LLALLTSKLHGDNGRCAYACFFSKLSAFLSKL
jgi:hypothetical protein